MSGPSRFFLSSKPPPGSPVQPQSTGIVDGVCLSDSSSGLYSPGSPNPNTPYLHRNAGAIPPDSTQLSSASTSDDESVSSWPLSRPPSLSQFEMDEMPAVTAAAADFVIPRGLNPDQSFEFAFNGPAGAGSAADSAPRVGGDRFTIDAFGDLIGVNASTSASSAHETHGSYQRHDSSSTSSTLPQLVMPRVALPGRKPFTTIGLSLGKLKVLVAGDSGIGKTELIKAILESSKHIVHVDEPTRYKHPREDESSAGTIGLEETINTLGASSANNGAGPLTASGGPISKSTSSANHTHSPSIVEISASTKPYSLYLIAHHEKKVSTRKPSQDDSSDSDVLFDLNDMRPQNARRPSLIHSLESTTSANGALSRNIGFVDTPGYGQYSDTTTCIQNVLSYLDGQFRETANTVNVSSPQVTNLLTSASSLTEFSHVDVCFYLILDRIKPVDINYISQLSRYAPVIPLISKSDQLQPDDIIDLKVSILKELKASNVSPFLFDTPIDDAIAYGDQLIRERKERRGSGSSIITSTADESKTDSAESVHPLLMPCTVSSNRNLDSEMLASVMMEPDYTIELVNSELKHLCRYIFSEHGSAWLRFITAKKFVEWISTVQVSNSLHSHKFLRQASSLNRPGYSENQYQQLVPYATNTDKGPTGLEILPEYFSSSPGSRAQLYNARWAMQLEQVSRTENVIAVRSRQMYRSRKQERNSTSANTNGNHDNTGGVSHRKSAGPTAAMLRPGPTSPTRPDGNISESIFNCDPLSLDKIISRALRCAVGAFTLLSSAGLVTWLYTAFATPAPVIAVEPKPATNILVATLNSLGGGWSVLV
ncbi:hypothetical protein AWJ20_1403 [Sugiyamaella lignohabitans]|uniref:Septin-type G domain-containing protein n=1 Tax=Sugiyamaella lignohabitans TaxID=796027 RepID=A0A167DP17_9ASCO|nr:uncharacterized protein AWJ20_1403 [Sugiyamaella lignohabitans]ANB13122.1 hypothetical protein AWJ20_1403 [Sugiyamaella lignohabitans]